MSIKSILCVFGGTPEELHALNIAFELGKLHEAHIRILHVSQDPSAYLYSGDLPGIAGILETLEKENQERVMKAKKYVLDFAAKHNVLVDDADIPLHHVSARFVHLSGVAGSLVAQEGLLSDLIIISRGLSTASMAYEATVLAALFDTGRPLLLIPVMNNPVLVPWRDKVIVLAWNGSLEAARAMYHALPYLERAEKLHVVQAREHRQPSDVTSSLALIDYLRAHGIRTTDVLSLDVKNESISRTLKSKAKELKADLIVMGAYGHNRYREILLGGVTRDLLEKSDLPLLLSH